jgi:hypothetical protein
MPRWVRLLLRSASAVLRPSGGRSVPVRYTPLRWTDPLIVFAPSGVEFTVVSDMRPAFIDPCLPYSANLLPKSRVGFISENGTANERTTALLMVRTCSRRR